MAKDESSEKHFKKNEEVIDRQKQGISVSLFQYTPQILQYFFAGWLQKFEDHGK